MAYDAKIKSAEMSINLEGVLTRRNADAAQGFSGADSTVFSSSSKDNYIGGGPAHAVATGNLVDQANFIDTVKFTIADGQAVTIDPYVWTFQTGTGTSISTGGDNLGVNTAATVMTGPLAQVVGNLSVLKGLVLKNTSTAATLTLKSSNAIADLFPVANDQILLKAGVTLGISANLNESATGDETNNGIAISTGDELTLTAGGGIASGELTVIGWTGTA